MDARANPMRAVNALSALPPEAGIDRTGCHVRLVRPRDKLRSGHFGHWLLGSVATSSDGLPHFLQVLLKGGVVVAVIIAPGLVNGQKKTGTD
jgi:hypothetical protein